MDLAIKIIMLVIFFGSMIGIGIYCRKNSTDVNGFVLGGRSVGPWLTAFAYGTSYFSAVVFVGYAGQFGWKYGISSAWAGVGNAVIGSLLAWAILGRRTRIMTQHLGSATMPQFFASRFDSQKLKLAASVLIFIFLIPYTASLYNGLSRLFGMAFNIDYAVCDEFIAKASLKNFPQLDISTPISFTQFYSWGINKKSKSLLDTINSWLDHFVTTKEFDELNHKYYNK